MAVTIREVAEHAGVSISTVSRVLNATCKVSASKMQRVEEAAALLGYAPNQVARSLLKKETGVLGVVLPFVGGEFFSEFLNGIDLTTRTHGYSLTISTSHLSLEEMLWALQNMYPRVDGLAILVPNGDGAVLAAMETVLAGRVSVVLVNTQRDGLAYPVVNFDNYGGAYQATEHLLALGHRRIAMLKGPERAFDARERLRGYRDALAAQGITPEAALEIAGDYSPEAGHAAAAVLMGLVPRPTAVFCANDQSAIALMSALQQSGLRIPEALSVIGFDDIPSARYTSPPLSTTHVPIRELGAEVIRRLVALVRKEHDSPREHVLPVQLAPRQSTAPLMNGDT